MAMNFKKVDYKSVPLYRNVSDKDWNDWKWQLQNEIRDINHLEKVITLTDYEKEHLSKCLEKFKMGITPYYASLMKDDYDRCPVRLQAVPSINELNSHPSDLNDPLHEDIDSPVQGLTHRYPDRVLLLVTKKCSMYCRHCTRRRSVGCDESGFNKSHFYKAVEYIKNHKEIRDVIISGGDPLVLSDSTIEYILKVLSDIETVEIIRIGTRTPVVLPQRITDELVNIIKKYQPVYVNTQFNTPDEMTESSKNACSKLADAGICLSNQTVLLKDINDCSHIMEELMHKLLQIRVRPYYIYQCDLTKGISHFRTSVRTGIRIMENLRGHTSGLAVPTYVVDVQGGGGKVPLMPNYILSWGERKLIVRNYEGVIASYTIPDDTDSDCGRCKICKEKSNIKKTAGGIAALLEGSKNVLQPEGLRRTERNITNNGNPDYVNT
ncbi:MAG: lysine 2,3-aminomutase [bacterium]|nr:lysine 2,3-aminomutase [bacterium]